MILLLLLLNNMYRLKSLNLLTGDLELMHAHATHYNNKVEHMYSFLQVMTAATASFTHGANDVSKKAVPRFPIRHNLCITALSDPT